MKRILAIALAALLLSAGPLATPTQGKEKPVPPCADINGSSGNSYYQVDAPGNPAHEAILSIQITTVEPLCTKKTTLTVYVSSDGTTFAAYTYPGDPGFSSCGPNCLTFTTSYGSTASAPSSASPAQYVYLETSVKKEVTDRAPDAGSPPFALCDHDPSTPDYDSNGVLIPECNPPGGEYFE
jgi:hypothetical protein